MRVKSKSYLSWFCITMPSDWLLRNSCHSVIKSEVKPMTHNWCLYIFLSVTNSVFKNACILIGSQHYLSVSSVFSVSDYFGFGFTPQGIVGGPTPIWRSLKDRVACRKIWIKLQGETNLGVAQLYLTPKRFDYQALFRKGVYMYASRLGLRDQQKSRLKTNLFRGDCSPPPPPPTMVYTSDCSCMIKETQKTGI